ncbi:hypothetical protein ACO0SA_003859 [Hanseniaspora valbyensis]
MSTPTLKKQKIETTEMSSIKYIITHSGSFHADEALGVAMLRMLPRFQNHQLIRSRDPKVWEKADIILDVGAEFDAKLNKFDHHQKSFNEFFYSQPEKQITKLSSAGLIYKYFGKEIIQEILNPIKISDDDMSILFTKIYGDFIEAIDANDNGVNCYDINAVAKYKNNNLSIPSIVSNLNPNWNDGLDDSPEESAARFDRHFEIASELVGKIFKQFAFNVGAAWLPAKNKVISALMERTDDGIIIFESYVAWKDHLLTAEKEKNLENEIKFVITKESSGSWRVITVPVKQGSFEFRVGLPTELRGLRDDDLSKAAGIPDGVFIHASGFIGGAKSKESCLKLARMGLAESKSK